jgi:hypothetical protein
LAYKKYIKFLSNCADTFVMIMKSGTKILPFLLALVACKATSTSGCLSTSSESLKLAESYPFVQGGYIQLGDKACNASFDVVGISADIIKLRAWSARHCRAENGIENGRTLVHLYFNDTKERTAGYVKNIPAREEFSTRASALAAELKSMGVPFEINAKFLMAMKIPTFAGADALDPRALEDSTSALPTDRENLVCQNENIAPRFSSLGNWSDLCWSALDVGHYDVEIRRQDTKPEDFKFLGEKLAERQKLAAERLKSKGNIAVFAADQRKQFESIQAMVRMQQAAPLAYFLSFDHCRISSNGTSLSAYLCKNQGALIDVAARHFVESDETGAKINIFDRLAKGKDYQVAAIELAGLKQGRRLPVDKTPTTYDAMLEKSRAYAFDFHSDYLVAAKLAMQKLVDRVKSNSIDADKYSLSSAFVVSSNVQLKSGNAFGDPAFAQFRLSDISEKQISIRIAVDTSGTRAIDNTIHGITQFGTLRLGIPREDERVTFGQTDSGSLLTFAGLVPLMVLNTVDDKGVSGGASILALPEAQPEVVSPSTTAVSKIPNSNDASKKKKNSVQYSACR